MQLAHARRDASYDGVFCVGVRTTGIFCRPSCAARRPRPENVRYFATAEEAQRAGYRACRRCRPLDVDGHPPPWVTRLLTSLETEPDRRLSDAELRTWGVAPARARRWFRRNFGMTFQAYQRTRRLEAARREISRGAELTGAGLRHGFDSLSGFRAAFERTFGKPPGRARETGCIHVDWLPSPIGPLLVGATDAAVCLLEFGEVGGTALERQAPALRRCFGLPVVPGRNAHLRQLAAELREYFAGHRRSFDVPLICRGTPFQEAVWAALQEIPYGQTICYEELASRVGRPAAQRAVGLANGRNRIAIVIPCHRVVNKGGRLGGYGGGLWRKEFLLALERGQNAPAAQDAAPARRTAGSLPAAAGRR